MQIFASFEILEAFTCRPTGAQEHVSAQQRFQLAAPSDKFDLTFTFIRTIVSVPMHAHQVARKDNSLTSTAGEAFLDQVLKVQR